MKWLNGYRMRLVVVGCVSVVILGGQSAQADFVFGERTNLGPSVNSGNSERGFSISADGLSLFFDSDQPDGGDYDLYVATRETIEAPWEPSVNLGPIVNSPATRNEAHPSISSDGLELFFSGQYWQPNATGYGQSDLWVTRRASLSDPWGSPENLGASVNKAGNDCEPSISADGLSLYFMSVRLGGLGKDIWVTTRPTINADWGVPTNLGAPVNSSGWEGAPTISADSLALFFQSDRSGGYGGRPAAYPFDIWMTRRTSTSDPWGEPVNLGPNVNTPTRDAVACISRDGHTLYFSSRDWWPRFGNFDIFQAPILPVVDFNGDGIVDSADMSIMVDHWGENYPLCDIGPTPWGDGIVDVEDLRVLFEYMSGYQPPIAHWTLDEKDGNTAHDKIGENDASVYGDALWFPTEGMFGGTLFLDGTDDYAITDPVRQHCSGAFSIVAWAKGWIPGRVIISQAMASNWLMADAAGNLISEIKSVDRADGSLLSETIITDGSWHRITLVWDGSKRTLYVDGALVAEDTRASLEISDTGLNLGVGKDYDPETHWSGFLDDVRIYDVALSTEQIAALTQ